MAFSYDDANDGVFTHLGKIIKHYNLEKARYATLDTLQSDIIDAIAAMTSGEPETITDGFPPEVENWKEEHTSRLSALVSLATTRLKDRESVIDELLLPDSGLQGILAAIIDQMNADSESVDASTVTIGTVTADGGNTGNGTALVTLRLDGVTSPDAVGGGRFPAHPAYADVVSELANVSETHVIECTADSYAASGGVSEGSESFSWFGAPRTSLHGPVESGSGVMGTIRPLSSRTSAFLTNADFETYSAGFTGWTAESGAFGTEITEDTTNEYHGAKCLAFVVTGSTAEISQAVSGLVPQRMYCLTARVKSTSVPAGTGTLTIQFEGTGYTAASSDKIVKDATTLTGTYELLSCFVLAPAVIPSDMELHVKIESATGTVQVDDINFGEVNYGGGVGTVVVRGSTPFVKGDRITYTVANNEAGAINSWFRRAYGVQLPSDTGGTETIADSLAS